MSTLRITNIEAKADPSSPTVDEKIKLTNSNGDILVHIDGKTSGITTIGINTTAGNIKFDQNSNVVVTGIITATKFVGIIEPTTLTVGGDLTIPDKIVHTGDTNTSIRFPAADTITAETAGTERLRITSDGKVGVNTNAATARLDINHPNTEQGLVVRSRYGNIATAMVKFDGDPDSNGGDGNVLHLHGGSSRTDSEILHIDSTGVGDIFDIRGDGLTRVYKQLQLEHSSNVAKIIFNEYGANDIKAQIEMDQVNGSAGQLIFRTQHGGTLSERLRITSDGHVLPSANNTYDLGSTAKGWRNVYMNDLNLSNMNGDTNDVDGTQGSWTIQEGKDNLYIINRLNGKKFKIKMEEIS